MRASSEAQRLAATAGGMPEPEQLDETLWSLPMPMRGGFLAYTLSGVLVPSSGAVTVLDPGWDLPGSLERLDGFLGSLGRSAGDIATVVCTHAHPDHLGLAAALRERSGAAVVLGRREQRSIDEVLPDPRRRGASQLAEWGVPQQVVASMERKLSESPRNDPPPLRADALVDDADLLPVEGANWRAVLTPGHTPGHLCVADEDRRVLFSGDHVLPTVFPGIGLGVSGPPSDGSALVDYLDSLAKLEPYDEWQVLPGHGYRFFGLDERRRDTLEHVLRRAREVEAASAAQPGASVWRIARGLTWTGGWERLSSSLMLFSALAQTEMYRDFVRGGGLASHSGGTR